MRKTKPLSIDSHLFPQLIESSKIISDKIIFQNLSTVEGKVNYRIISFDDHKFDEVLYYAKSSSNFVPLLFDDYAGNKNQLTEVKGLEVEFLAPLKFYSVFGISFIYRMVTSYGDLLFTITDKVIDVSHTKKIINARIKKHLEYFNGNIINNINYLKVVEK